MQSVNQSSGCELKVSSGSGSCDYYYYKCHGLECCHHIVAGALYKNLDLKLLHSSMQTSADHRSVHLWFACDMWRYVISCDWLVLVCVHVQFSCAARVNFAGVITEYVHSVTSYFVGIKVSAVSWHLHNTCMLANLHCMQQATITYYNIIMCVTVTVTRTFLMRRLQ